MFSLNSANSVTKIFVTIKGPEPATSWVWNQDATTAPARHMWDTESLNWSQFMFQWFMRFPEFAEISEIPFPIFHFLRFIKNRRVGEIEKWKSIFKETWSSPDNSSSLGKSRWKLWLVWQWNLTQTHASFYGQFNFSHPTFSQIKTNGLELFHSHSFMRVLSICLVLEGWQWCDSDHI